MNIGDWVQVTNEAGTQIGVIVGEHRAGPFRSFDVQDNEGEVWTIGREHLSPAPALRFSHADSEGQGIDVYFTDGAVRIALPDRQDEQSGPVVELPLDVARKLAAKLTELTT